MIRDIPISDYIKDPTQYSLLIDMFPLNGNLAQAEFTITSADILDKSFTIDRRCAHSEQFELGTVDSCELKFSIANFSDKFTDVKFEGRIVQPWVIRLSDGVKLQSLGLFTIDERPIKQRVMTIRALDFIARFDIPFVSTDYTFPTTVKALIRQFCNKVGIQYALSDDLPNLDYRIDEIDSKSKMTVHQVLNWLATLLAHPLGMRSGGLQLKEYRVNPLAELDLNLIPIKNKVLAESPVRITGVKFLEKGKNLKDKETQDVTHLVGTEDYCLDVSNNPLITHDIESVLHGIHLMWQDVRFLPFKDITMLALPQLELMDTLVIDGVFFIITSIDYKFGGMMKLRGSGETKRAVGYATPTGFTDSQRSEIGAVIVEQADNIERIVKTGLEKELDNLHLSISQAIGFYTTVKVDESGRKTIYTHDKPNLEESAYIEHKGATGELVWTDSGWNNGRPEWKYGYSKEGSLIMRFISAVGINAEYINLEDGVKLKTYLDNKISETKTLIDNMGAKITETITIDGEPLATKIAQLASGFLRLQEDISNAKAQDSSNLLLNPTFGSDNNKELIHWIDESKTWGDQLLNGARWLDMLKYTWGQILRGD